MSNFVHFVMCPMTGVGLYGGYRGDAWYENRIEIFKNYTLKSLINQTNRNFILWMTFRPQERYNYFTAGLEDYLRMQNIQYVLTFDGLMYHDDKFTYGYYRKAKNFGRVIRGCYRNRTWRDLLPSLREIRQDKNKSLESRIAHSLLYLRQYCENADWIYLTRIDSDDMFHKEAIAEIQSMPVFTKRAYIFQNGYIYNKDTGQLAQYHPQTNPPFHTIVFPKEIFWDAKNHKEYYGSFESHEDIPKIFDVIQLSNYRYCVLTHNPQYHISTIFSHPFRGKIIENEQEILKDFGIWAT